MNSTVFILIWIACGFGGYAIGKSKGREVLGAVLGFLLGVIGLIIIAVIPGDKTKS